MLRKLKGNPIRWSFPLIDKCFVVIHIAVVQLMGSILDFLMDFCGMGAIYFNSEYALALGGYFLTM